MQLEFGPSAMIVCLDGSLNCNQRKRLLFDVGEQNARTSGYEVLNTEAIVAFSSPLLPTNLFVNAAGQVKYGKPDRQIEYDSGFWAVKFSPTGRTIAAASRNSRIGIWDVNSGALVRSLVGHSGAVRDVAFNSDGSLLVSGAEGRNNNIKLWNPETGALIRTLTGHDDTVWSVAFSPDSQLIASGSKDDTVKVWSATTGDLLHTLSGHTANVQSIAFRPDGAVLASAGGGGDETIRLWDPNTGDLIHTIVRAHEESVWSVAFSRDGSRLFSGGQDRLVKWWTADGRTLVGQQSVTATVYDVVPDRAGRMFAVVGATPRVNVYSITGIHARIFQSMNTVWSADLSPDDRSLVVVGEDSKIRMWTGAEGGLRSLSVESIGLPLSGQAEMPVEYLAAYSGNQIRLKRPYTWRPKCGDGVVDEGELFDHGQPLEDNEYAAQCGATCGDNFVQTGEDCDDGDQDNTDECLTSCRPHRCGDGIVRQDRQPGEESYESCDDGNSEIFDGCNNDCDRCGDGNLGVGEVCDDGNDIANDGCTSCAMDTCGNERLDEGERCELGNENCARCMFSEFVGSYTYSYSPSPDFYGDQNRER